MNATSTLVKSWLRHSTKAWKPVKPCQVQVTVFRVFGYLSSTASSGIPGEKSPSLKVIRQVWLIHTPSGKIRICGHFLWDVTCLRISFRVFCQEFGLCGSRAPAAWTVGVSRPLGSAVLTCWHHRGDLCHHTQTIASKKVECSAVTRMGGLLLRCLSPFHFDQEPFWKEHRLEQELEGWMQQFFSPTQGRIGWLSGMAYGGKQGQWPEQEEEEGDTAPSPREERRTGASRWWACATRRGWPLVGTRTWSPSGWGQTSMPPSQGPGMAGPQSQV